MKTTLVIRKIVMPKYTRGSLTIGKSKQISEKLKAFTTTAFALVNFEPPLSDRYSCVRGKQNLRVLSQVK